MEKTYSKKAISYELATQMVEAAIARAKELNCKQNVAVVDDGGNLKAFGRMDGAPLLGEHNEGVLLRYLGLSTNRIAALTQSGVLVQEPLVQEVRQRGEIT